MSAWAAIVAREASVTASAGVGLLHSVAPSAVDGFAAGALLTGVCFVVAVAPRLQRRPRLSARPEPWPGRARHASYPAGHSYSAPPADTNDAANGVTAAASPAGRRLVSAYSGAPAEAAATMPQPSTTFAASSYAAAPAGPGYLHDNDAVAATPGAEFAADAGFAAGRGARDLTAPEAWSFTPPPREQFARAADSHPYPEAFRAPVEDEILVPYPIPVAGSVPPAATPRAATPPAGDQQAGDQQAAIRSGYRSKHRVAAPEGERFTETRRQGPRHAAPSARFTARRSARLGTFPLPARG